MAFDTVDLLSTIVPGDKGKFELTVTNQGPSDAVDVVLRQLNDDGTWMLQSSGDVWHLERRR